MAPVFVVVAHLLIAAPGFPTALAAGSAPLQVPQPGVVAGTVRDASAAVVAGATVVVRSSTGAEQRATTGADGRFSVAGVAAGPVTLIVRASGFTEFRQSLASSAARQGIDVALVPASVQEAVTVTPTRTEQRMGDVPASVTVLGREEIRRSPAVVADDLLRQLPTFSLFRRTSSLSSHPTAQGVSLRGIGPSGVSRTLVLIDGVPFNDPFGGWVYWSRVPLESADRIEVVDGASSSLYGTYAMGGVINILTRPPARRSLDLRTQYGNFGSPKIDVLGSDVWGKVGVSVDASGFDTDGYPIVVASERGLVDNKATVSFRNVNVRLDYAPTDQLRAFARFGRFREERDNGKASTIDGTEEANDTTWTSVSAGVQAKLPGQNRLDATIFTDDETFRSNFLAVPAATPLRSIGRMTLNQRVPTTGVGGMVQWSRAFASKHVISAGSDWRWVDGDSVEDGLDATTGTTVTLHRVSGGTQRNVGLFAQDVFSPVRDLTVTLSARVDAWKNYNAHNLENNVPSGTPTVNDNAALPSRDDTVASPHIGARYRITDKVSVWGSAGQGFRAPTLNELYRQFRVGAILTLANNQLGPERLTGGEVGINIAPLRQLTWRTTWFGNWIKDPVSNVTTATNVQQRQNLGRTRIRGVQTDVEWRVGSSLVVGAGYLFNAARVLAYDANPQIVGKFLPQVPKHRGSVRVGYTNPRFIDFAVSVQAMGTQFDDDLNSRVVPGYVAPGLPKYAVVSLTASRKLHHNLEAFVGAQNLFNQQYYVGTLPTTIGSPRLINGGVRVSFSAK